MSSFLKCLIAACFFSGVAGMATQPPGFVEGHLKILSPREVELADGNASAITAENYAPYPLIILSQASRLFQTIPCASIWISTQVFARLVVYAALSGLLFGVQGNLSRQFAHFADIVIDRACLKETKSTDSSDRNPHSSLPRKTWSADEFPPEDFCARDS